MCRYAARVAARAPADAIVDLNMLQHNMFHIVSAFADDRLRQLLSARVFIARRGRKARAGTHRERKSSSVRGSVDRIPILGHGPVRAPPVCSRSMAGRSKLLHCNDSRASHRSVHVTCVIGGGLICELNMNAVTSFGVLNTMEE